MCTVNTFATAAQFPGDLDSAGMKYVGMLANLDPVQHNRRCQIEAIEHQPGACFERFRRGQKLPPIAPVMFSTQRAFRQFVSTYGSAIQPSRQTSRWIFTRYLCVDVADGINLVAFGVFRATALAVSPSQFQIPSSERVWSIDRLFERHTTASGFYEVNATSSQSKL